MNTSNNLNEIHQNIIKFPNFIKNEFTKYNENKTLITNSSKTNINEQPIVFSESSTVSPISNKLNLSLNSLKTQNNKNKDTKRRHKSSQHTSTTTTESPDIDNNIVPTKGLEQLTDIHATTLSPAHLTEKSESRKKSHTKWSPWSKWSSCSRSCGGGVKSQSRQCLSKT